VAIRQNAVFTSTCWWLSVADIFCSFKNVVFFILHLQKKQISFCRPKRLRYKFIRVTWFKEICHLSFQHTRTFPPLSVFDTLKTAPAAPEITASASAGSETLQAATLLTPLDADCAHTFPVESCGTLLFREKLSGSSVATPLRDWTSAAGFSSDVSGVFLRSSFVVGSPESSVTWLIASGLVKSSAVALGLPSGIVVAKISSLRDFWFRKFCEKKSTKNN